VVGDADADAVASGDERIRHGRGALDDDGDRTGEEGPHEPLLAVGDADVFEGGVDARHAERQRLRPVAALRLEDAFDRRGVEGVSAEAVHRLSRVDHKVAVDDGGGGAFDGLVHVWPVRSSRKSVPPCYSASRWRSTAS
jgi:hypothetical protein